MTKTYLLPLIAFLISSKSLSQNIQQQPLLNEMGYRLVSYSTYQNERPGHRPFHKGMADDGFMNFVKRFHLRNEAIKIINGKRLVVSFCNDLLYLGLFVDANKISKIQLDSQVKSKAIDAELINKIIEGADTRKSSSLDNSNSIVFLDLYEIFTEAFAIGKDELSICCSEESDIDTIQYTISKVCSAFELHGGIAIQLIMKGDMQLPINVHFKSDLVSEFPKIEPRQYVTIYEKKENKTSPEPIWWLERRTDYISEENFPVNENRNEFTKLFPFQKYKVIDENAVLEIHFDQEAIASNLNFQGNISLKANSGDKDIEVSPYFVAGEKQKALGVNSKPIKEIADIFLRMMIEAKRIELINQEGLNDIIDNFRKDNERNMSQQKVNTIERLKERVNKLLIYLEIDSSRSGDTIRKADLNYENYKVLDEILNDVSSDTLYIFNNILKQRDLTDDSYLSFRNNYFLNRINRSSQTDIIPFTYTQILNRVRGIKGKLDDQGTKFVLRREKISDMPVVDKKSRVLYEDFLMASNRCLRYMSFFESSGLESLNAFLSLSNVTKVDFHQIYIDVKNSITYINNNFNSWEKIENEKSFEKRVEATLQLNRIINSIQDLNTFNQKFHKILHYYNYSEDFIVDSYLKKMIQTGDRLMIDRLINYYITRTPALYNSIANTINSVSQKNPTIEQISELSDSLDVKKEQIKDSIIQEHILANLPDIINDEYKLSKTGLNRSSKDDKIIRDWLISVLDPGITLTKDSSLLDYLRISKRELLEDKNFSLIYDENAYLKIRDELALEAGRGIYNKLVYATIDLKNQMPKNSNEIEISVIWYNIYNGDDSEQAQDGITLSTAKFFVTKTGWHLTGSESVLLLHRINEDLVTVDVSPSNFKPVAGASLLWTYYNEYRGKKKWKWARWLEPSFGINVSYLDFRESQTFEVGAGPIIGLWQNRVFLTGGYNFNVKGQSPFYMGIGFSFYNVVTKIAEGGKLKLEEK